MSKFFKLSLIFLASVVLFSCSTESSKMRSSGGHYEVFVICSDAQWNGPLGDTLRAILLEPVAMINQREPIFDLAHVPGSAYKGLITQHRNLLRVSISEQHTEAQLLAVYDQYAQPQIILSLNAPSTEAATDFIWENRKNLVSILEKAESERAVAFYKKHHELALENAVSKKFDFKMSIPRGYTMRNNAIEDFMWISNELPLASQGIVIYTYPYSGKNDFSIESLVKRRNEFVGKIPGQLEGTHMKTAEIEPDIKYVKISGRNWAQMNGFWDVYNDFMGGPFVSYSTLDAENQRVVCIDMYVYSPKNRKRNYLRALENLVYSVQFPGDNTAKTDKK